jgi:hypothetical protein
MADLQRQNCEPPPRVKLEKEPRLVEAVRRGPGGDDRAVARLWLIAMGDAGSQY